MLGFLFVLGGGDRRSPDWLPRSDAGAHRPHPWRRGRTCLLPERVHRHRCNGSLLFYIGYDKIRQKQFMAILRRETEQPEPYREPPPY